MAHKEQSESWLRFMRSRFLPTLFSGIKARLAAQMIGFALAVLILMVQIHYGVIPGNNVQLRARLFSIAWPYIAVLTAFLIFHLGRTPWLISNEHLHVIKDGLREKLALQNEMDQLKSIPPSLDVRMRQIYRTPHKGGTDRNADGEMSWDLFLDARVELETPLSLIVSKYTLQLSRHGKTISLQPQPDVSEWELNLWTVTKLSTIEMVDLPWQLKSGQPAEGWLHFIVERASYKVLDESRVRLLVDTGTTEAYREHEATPLIWNPVPELKVTRKL